MERGAQFSKSHIFENYTTFYFSSNFDAVLKKMIVTRSLGSSIPVDFSLSVIVF